MKKTLDKALCIGYAIYIKEAFILEQYICAKPQYRKPRDKKHPKDIYPTGTGVFFVFQVSLPARLDHAIPWQCDTTVPTRSSRPSWLVSDEKT